jgi:hypothetical protein
MSTTIIGLYFLKPRKCLRTFHNIKENTHEDVILKKVGKIYDRNDQYILLSVTAYSNQKYLDIEEEMTQ